MDFVIIFFRDVLDGPLYIVVSIICSILICSCIGYMGEIYLRDKKIGEDFASKHATIDDPEQLELAKKEVENAVVNPDGSVSGVLSQDVVQSDTTVSDTVSETVITPEQEVEENASVTYAIGGAQVEELLEDD